MNKVLALLAVSSTFVVMPVLAADNYTIDPEYCLAISRSHALAFLRRVAASTNERENSLDISARTAALISPSTHSIDMGLAAWTSIFPMRLVQRQEISDDELQVGQADF